METRRQPRSRTLLFLSKAADDPSTRYRAILLFPHLRELGWDPVHVAVSEGPLGWLSLARRAHAVIVLRRTFHAPLRRLLRLLSRRLIFDLDDAIFTTSRGPSRGRARRFEVMARTCDGVWAGNDYLAEHARAFNPSVAVLPTALDPEQYSVRVEQPPDSIDLVWIGSSSNRQYLAAILPALGEAGAAVPRLRLKVIADFELPAAPLRTISRAWSGATEARELASSHIGIAPLSDDPWTRGKCGFKLLQYMAAGLPAISSPVGANARILVHGTTGFLAAGALEWIDAIRRLSADPELRGRMGQAGRHRVIERYSLKSTAVRMSALLTGNT
jgi:glycosyltransferase involved in cell wall biosynthesis